MLNRQHLAIIFVFVLIGLAIVSALHDLTYIVSRGKIIVVKFDRSDTNVIEGDFKPVTEEPAK